MTSLVWIPQPSNVPAPSEVAAYLRAQGWILESTRDRWAEWARQMGAEKVTIETPQQSTARDYARALGALVADLARLEKREPVELLRDMKSASTDIVRIGIEGSLTRDGRIPVEAGARV